MCLYNAPAFSAAEKVQVEKGSQEPSSQTSVSTLPTTYVKPSQEMQKKYDEMMKTRVLQNHCYCSSPNSTYTIQGKHIADGN